MSRHTHNTVRFLPLLLSVFLLTCGDGPRAITDPVGGGDGSIVTISVTPATPTITGVGTTQQFQAQPRDASGSPVTATITWTSANSGVATVDENGLATATGVGTTAITAAAAGKSGTGTLTVLEAPPQFEGFDFALATGDYWDFYWSYEYNSVSGPQAPLQDQSPTQAPAANSHSVTGGYFRVTLGQQRTIDGVTAYEIVISGDIDDGDWDYTPRWQYMAIYNHQLLGSETGQTLEVVFDAKNGTWIGGGFWATYGDDTEVSANQSSIDNAFITAQAISVRRSSGQSFCETIAGITVCPNDQSWTFNESEYYKRGIGPIGFHSYAGYSFSGGGFFDSFSHDRHIGLVASSLAGADSVVPYAPPWVEKASMPTARSKHTASVVNGKVYVIGGETRTESGSTVLGTVDIYDPATDTWTSGTPMPGGAVRTDHSAAVVNNKIYIVGGRATSSGSMLDSTWEYDPATGSWTILTAAPTVMAGHSSAPYAGYVWVFKGGQAAVYAHEVATDIWWAGTDSPTRRYEHSAAVIGDYIYLTGGSYTDWSPWVGNFTAYSKTVLEYDLTESYGSADAWNYMTSMEVGRSRLASTVLANKIYAIGGYNGDGPSIAVEMYDPATNTWVEKFPLLSGRQSHAAVTVNGKIYVIGGAGYWDSVPTVLEYDPSNDR
jgi:N-acetylneuraminic acid mutarotase